VANRISSLNRLKLARERGTIRKDWGGRISLALTYPHAYRVGMSNLGFQFVYHLLNTRDDIVAERVFLPDGPEHSLHDEGGKGILSLESLSPLQRFNIVAFSLSFENDYPNVLKILDMAAIPLLSEERAEQHPLIMAGGVTTFLNPEPLARYMDLFLVGEAETILDAFLDLFCEAGREKGAKRRDVLLHLARSAPSVYVPSLYRVNYYKDGTLKSREPLIDSIPERIKVSRPRDLPHPAAASAILTEDTEFSNRVLVELARGCGRSCRFCAAGYVYRPPRVQPVPAMLSCLDKIMEKENRLGLLAPSVSDVPGIEEITQLILNKGGTFSLSSLRADALREPVLEHLKKGGQRTLAIAPEAGSERLRKVINKHLTEEQIIQTVQRVAAVGTFTLRLYFLIGLPTETQEDMNEIVRLVKVIKHWLVKGSRKRGRVGLIRLSVNCFIPKAFTPFQWCPMEEVVVLKEKQKWLKRALHREGGVQVSFDLPKWAYVQSLLSMGDRRVGQILLRAHEHGEDWSAACRFSDVNSDFFVYRPKGLEEVLPWDFLDHGIRKEHLIKEYKLALKEEESDACSVGECRRCGVCPGEGGGPV